VMKYFIWVSKILSADLSCAIRTSSNKLG
jgi:hypothetical protein